VSANAAPPRRADWPFHHAEPIRFGDLDAMRHLNNVEFLRFFETARIAFMQSIFPDHDPAAPTGDFGLIFAEAHIAYRSPGRFGETVRTWIRPGAIARSSFRVEFEMRADDPGAGPDGRLLAEGYGVLVGYDYGAQAAMPLPERVAAALAAVSPWPGRLKH
jgi:acyl-CoA thioester hydrolase